MTGAGDEYFSPFSFKKSSKQKSEESHEGNESIHRQLQLQFLMRKTSLSNKKIQEKKKKKLPLLRNRQAIYFVPLHNNVLKLNIQSSEQDSKESDSKGDILDKPTQSLLSENQGHRIMDQ